MMSYFFLFLVEKANFFTPSTINMLIIVAGVVGGIFALCLFAIISMIIVKCCCKKKLKKKNDKRVSDMNTYSDADFAYALNLM